MPAVVLGACAHGLAVTRALSRAGIEVHVLEANLSLPGLKSRFGDKHLVDDINGPGLVDELLALRERLAPQVRPVLFVMNDTMVRTVAEEIHRIEPAFRLSWAPCASDIARLTDKMTLAEHCQRVGLNYPHTTVVSSIAECDSKLAGIGWPRVLKPARPLSGFKVHVAESLDDAIRFLQQQPDSFPILVQEWIPGDAGHIHFCALYLQDGRAIARFDGRKLRAVPMGHTTVAEPSRDDRVHECTARFFADSRLSGPVSLEVKFDPSGRAWVIEPTVGRTDFWVDLCISNSVNLPLIEYEQQLGHEAPAPSQGRRAVWVNGSTDRMALAWYAARAFHPKRWHLAMRFAYLDLSDLGPFWAALHEFGMQVLNYLSR